MQDEYIIIPPGDVPLSHYYCNNSPLGISTGSSINYNMSRREFLKMRQDYHHELALNTRIGRKLLKNYMRKNNE